MSDITDFLGNQKEIDGTDLFHMILWGNEKLEEVHNFIQWMFPNRTASQHNLEAPLLTDEDIQAIESSDKLKMSIALCCERMIRFYFIDNDSWKTPGNHNFLRITRIFLFLSEFKFTSSYKKTILLNLLKEDCPAFDECWGYWYAALDNKFMGV